MAEPTREELLAQNEALRLELSRRTFTPGASRFGGVAFDPLQPLPVAPQPPPVGPVVRRYAVPGHLLSRKGKSATPEEILAQIASIKTVIVSGVDSAGYGDKRTDFRTLSELRQILADLEQELESALGIGGRVRQIRMTTQADKGL